MENIKFFMVEDWVLEWQKKDILDDKHQYGEKINLKEFQTREK